MKNIIISELELEALLRNAFIQGERYQEDWALEQVGEVDEVTEQDFGEWYNSLELSIEKTSKKIIIDKYYLSTDDFINSNDLEKEAQLILGEDWITEDDIKQIQLILDTLFGEKQYFVQCIEGLKSDYDIQILKKYYNMTEDIESVNL